MMCISVYGPYPTGSIQNGTVMHFWDGALYNEYNSDQEDSLAVVNLLVRKGADLLAMHR